MLGIAFAAILLNSYDVNDRGIKILKSRKKLCPITFRISSKYAASRIISLLSHNEQCHEIASKIMFLNSKRPVLLKLVCRYSGKKFADFLYGYIPLPAVRC